MDEELSRYLATHHGVITRAQVKRLGMTDGQIRRRLRTGAFLRIAPRTFRIATSPDSWEARARAAALAARGLVSHTTALRVWKVDGWLATTSMHVTVAGNRRPRADGVTIHRPDNVSGIDGRIVNGVPVTDVTRAVIDSASLLPANEIDPLIDAVVRQKLASTSDLSRELTRLGTAGRKGSGLLKRLLDERDPTNRIPDSRFNRLVGQLLVRSGLPRPTYEWEVRASGTFIGRADLAYPAANLLLECDSSRWHHNRQSFVADPRRKNRFLLANYRVLTFTWDDYVGQPSDIVATVGSALGRGLDAAVS